MNDSLVMMAAKDRNVEKIKNLAEEKEISLDEVDGDGRNALHIAAQSGHVDSVKYLLKSGIDIDSTTKEGWTPLMIACTTDSLNVVDELLKNGASLTLTNRDGYTPFHIACREGQYCIINLLLDFDPGCWETSNNIGSTPLHTAAEIGRLDVVQLLLERGNYQKDSKNDNGLTPAMCAANGYHKQIVECLQGNQTDRVSTQLPTGHPTPSINSHTGSSERDHHKSEEKIPLRMTITRLSEPHDYTRELKNDIQIAFSAEQKYIPSQYHYDEVGSVLFEAVTKLPEYYVARIETAILHENAAEIMKLVRPNKLVELGSGSSTKTCLLLEAMHTMGGDKYVPIEISETALYQAAETLSSKYEWLHIDGYVGSYHTDLPLVKISDEHHCLLTFLGTTLGNYSAQVRREILQQIATFLRPGDAMLLGIDTVKNSDTILHAYNDPTGVNARFNINVLNVVNRELGADFDIPSFTYCPTWNEETSSVEYYLKANREMTVNIPALDMRIELSKDELILICVSCKFTRETISQELSEVGLKIAQWYTDSDNMYAVLLVTPTKL